MTETQQRKKTPAPKWKKGDMIQRAGMIFAKLTGDVSYSGALHTEQYLAPAVYHDGSSGQFASSPSDKKIDPETITVVLCAPKEGQAVLVALEEFAQIEAEILGAKDDNYDDLGVAEAVLADKLGLDSIFSVSDYRIRNAHEEAAIVTVAELFE